MNFYEGTLRSGKSATAVKEMFLILDQGGLIGINFSLVPDWAEKFARRKLPKFVSNEKVLKLADDYWHRLYRIGSVDSLYEFAKHIPKQVKGRRAKSREEQALVVFDECGLFFNSRDWKKNKEYINFFTNSGKLKTDIIMISHSFDDIDKQIRAKCEYLTTFRNMKKLKVGGVPIGAMLRKPVFRSVMTFAGKASMSGMTLDKYYHILDMKTCDLYDTFTLFEDGDDGLELQKVGLNPYEEYERKQEEDRRQRLFRAAPASCWPIYNQ